MVFKVPRWPPTVWFVPIFRRTPWLLLHHWFPVPLNEKERNLYITFAERKMVAFYPPPPPPPPQPPPPPPPPPPTHTHTHTGRFLSPSPPPPPHTHTPSAHTPFIHEVVVLLQLSAFLFLFLTPLRDAKKDTFPIKSPYPSQLSYSCHTTRRYSRYVRRRQRRVIQRTHDTINRRENWLVKIATENSSAKFEGFLGHRRTPETVTDYRLKKWCSVKWCDINFF